jgi:hypothetical protein
MSVRSKSYVVSVEIDEREQTILKAQCHDCAASLGGCKHAVALVFWLHRRCYEPSPTEVKCYWNKSVLGQVGTTTPFVRVADLNSKKQKTCHSSNNASDDCGIFEMHGDFLAEVIRIGRESNCRGELLAHFDPSYRKQFENLEIHCLMFGCPGMEGSHSSAA